MEALGLLFLCYRQVQLSVTDKTGGDLVHWPEEEGRAVSELGCVFDHPVSLVTIVGDQDWDGLKLTPSDAED